MTFSAQSGALDWKKEETLAAVDILGLFLHWTLVLWLVSTSKSRKTGDVGSKILTIMNGIVLHSALRFQSLPQTDALSINS
jgi:hypothetical protein